MTSLRVLLILFAAIVLGAMAFRLRSNGIRTENPGASVGGITTIFVPPFTVVGNSAELSSGARLSEQVRAALSADKSVAAAGRASAHYVLTGTVTRKQGGAEIVLRLVHASNGSTAWSGTFWKSAADFSSSAGDLAAAVSDAIRAERDSEARRRVLQSSRTRELR